ncbi:hypothetical protein [Streptomyces sp. NPDC000134]|uniref:hypothetical protein n=1 Tax=Streptomyces sp. NPDC000134 TaxID=3364536 RepID=UPI0036853465
MSRKNILDKMIDRADDINRDMRKATRRAVKSRKKRGNRDKAARKLARRNSEDIRALATQVALLSANVSALTERDAGTGSAPASGGGKG